MTCLGTGSCSQGLAPCRDGCNKPKRTCAELGVCQGRTPPCSDDCENPAIVPDGLPAMRLITDNSDGTSPHGDPFNWISDLWYATKWTLAGSVVAAIFLLLTLRIFGVI